MTMVLIGYFKLKLINFLIIIFKLKIKREGSSGFNVEEY